ncbi:MAG: hypothetical protein KAI06_11085 [Anaerolineales bacterium]|nr:hypothetical protein [Anaerolineales bacterium]
MQKPSWIDVSAGIVPFIFWGFILIASEIPHDWSAPRWLDSLAFIIVILLLLLPAGVGIGWVLGFPRWSYTYLTSAVLVGAYLVNGSTPGLEFFGYQTFGRELWGWRAWIPLLTALVIALLVSRSLRPLVMLFTNIRKDLTLLTYSLFGVMPLLVLIFYDEMDRLFSLYFMVAFTAVSIVASFFYLRSPQTLKGSSALLVGVLISVLILVIGPNVYWQSHGGMNSIPSIISGLVLIIVMLSPVLIDILKKSRNEMAA